MKSYVTAADLQ